MNSFIYSRMCVCVCLCASHSHCRTVNIMDLIPSIKMSERNARVIVENRIESIEIRIVFFICLHIWWNNGWVWLMLFASCIRLDFKIKTIMDFQLKDMCEQTPLIARFKEPTDILLVGARSHCMRTVNSVELLLFDEKQNEERESFYQTLDWTICDGSTLTVHREQHFRWTHLIRAYGDFSISGYLQMNTRLRLVSFSVKRH